MKFLVAFLALVALGHSAPQPRKLFHEHYEDFLMVILEEAGEEIAVLGETYAEFEEFLAGVEYLLSPRFRNLVYEMESLPEFNAVVEFLEGHNIDILYFIDQINEAVDSIANQRRGLLRQEVSGRDISSYTLDSIKVFPKDKLAALYNEKIANFESFSLAMESFNSQEWDDIYSAMWKSEVFLKEVQELGNNGIDVQVVLYELRAILGIFD